MNTKRWARTIASFDGITEFENFTVVKPGDQNVTVLRALLSQVITWSAALASPRAAHANA